MSPTLTSGVAAVPRERTVTAMGTLIGACFALRGAVPLVCVRLLHLEPSSGAAIGLAIVPAMLLLLGFHSVGSGASSTGIGAHQPFTWKSPVVRCLGAYLVFAGTSLLWSISVSPASSAIYWCSLLLDAAMLLLLLSLYAAEDVATSVLRGYVLGACAVAVLAWLMPSQADLRLGDADFFNTNQIANICAFGIFFAQYLQRRSIRGPRLPILVLSLTLLRTLSKTTLLAFLLSQGLLLFCDGSITPRTRRRVLLWAAVVLVASSGLLASYYDIYTNAGNQAQTLTGRTAIWAWALDKIPEALWLGHGFDSMWKVMPAFGIDRFEARHAENEFLQQLYAYGIVGTFLFAALYLSIVRAVRRTSDGAIRPVLKALLLFVFLRGLAEAEPFDLLLPVWVLLLIAAITTQGKNSTVEATPPDQASPVRRASGQNRSPAAVGQALGPG